jgi:hypothetical protein
MWLVVLWYTKRLARFWHRLEMLQPTKSYAKRNKSREINGKMKNQHEIRCNQSGKISVFF